jgi:hypothetical protein
MSPELLLLAQLADTWRSRPSQMLGLGGTPAFQIDAAAAAVLWRWREFRLKTTSSES